MIRSLIGRLRRACAFAPALALVLAPVAAEAFFVPHYQRAWPALANSGSFTPACVRLGFATNGAAESSNVSVLSHDECPGTRYAISSIRCLFANFYVNGSGGNNPETPTGNSLNVDFATAFVNGTAYPFTFGGALGVAIPSGGFVWTDPLMNGASPLTIAALQAWFVRASQTVPANGVIPVALTGPIGPYYTNSTVGDGVGYYTSPQTSKRTSGTVPAYNNGSSNAGPALCVAQGWDGSKVYAIVGDSIGAGQNDGDISSPDVVGAEQRALWDAASGNRNYVNMAFYGTKPEDQASIAAGQQQLRMRALRSLPNRPFNEILSEMGQNSPTMVGTSLAAFQTVEQGYWGFWRNECPECSLFQVTFPAHAGSANYTDWTTLADQGGDYPTGIRWQGGAWIAANLGLPSYVTGIDLTTPFTTGSGFTSQAGLWPITGWSATLAAAPATNQRYASIAGATAPTAGDDLVFEPGTSNVEIQSIISVTGSASPWTVWLGANIAKTHASGAAVGAATTYEGTHAGTRLYKAAANALIALKTSGALP